MGVAVASVCMLKVIKTILTDARDEWVMCLWSGAGACQ